jgi:hypothetical protein
MRERKRRETTQTIHRKMDDDSEAIKNIKPENGVGKLMNPNPFRAIERRWECEKKRAGLLKQPIFGHQSRTD